MSVKQKVDVILANYTSGSWNTYQLTDYEPPGPLTCDMLRRNMQVLNETFKVDVSFFPSHELIYWELSLEEKAKSIRTRSGEGSSAQERKAPKAIKYKFAVCDDEGLLFANKSIPLKLRKTLQIILHCKDFNIMDLSGSDPINLLMLYKQSSKRAPNLFKVQFEETMANAEEDIQVGTFLRDDALNKNTTDSIIQQKLGCHKEQIPLIKRVTATVKNVPIKTQAPALKHFRLSSLELEVHAPSVFHIYKELGERGVIKDIPPWLGKMRASGKTHCVAQYN
ncbi:hypothetical protein OTU49_001663 [Cherax quadricarinatus]|uniref:Uncharacterized protein n=1 Tax=Cherax quadricarinatus TaxID=27406 RepID=A0AAW0XE10_CHEQU|nr:uncharacterized protein LOC128691130 isoform X2 [Cherax quadricarinatus]